MSKLNYVYLALLWLPFALQTEAATVKPLDSLTNVGEKVYGTKNPAPLKLVIGNIIKTILGFVGILFIIMIIWSGFQWMTSGGNEEKVGTAKKRIINATIGLTLIILAYAIAHSITKWLLTASEGGSSSAPTCDDLGGVTLPDGTCAI